MHTVKLEGFTPTAQEQSVFNLNFKLHSIILLVGPDGSGKSTCALKTVEGLLKQGKKAIYTKHPGATPLGQKLRELLKHGLFLPPPSARNLSPLREPPGRQSGGEPKFQWGPASCTLPNIR